MRGGGGSPTSIPPLQSFRRLHGIAVHPGTLGVGDALLAIAVPFGTAADGLGTTEDMGGSGPAPIISALAEQPLVAVAAFAGLGAIRLLDRLGIQTRTLSIGYAVGFVLVALVGGTDDVATDSTPPAPLASGILVNGPLGSVGSRTGQLAHQVGLHQWKAHARRQMGTDGGYSSGIGEGKAHWVADKRRRCANAAGDGQTQVDIRVRSRPVAAIKRDGGA